jgi:general secretion pathway protein G
MAKSCYRRRRITAPVPTSPPGLQCSRAQSSNIEGFTLIEVLVVLAIIGMIMGLTAPRVLIYLSSSKEQAARLQIQALSTALELYYLDTGTYPDESQGLAALVEKPQDATVWAGPYLKSGLPNDPWGEAYIYRVPGQYGPYEIHSNGIAGAEDAKEDASIGTSRHEQ